MAKTAYRVRNWRDYNKSLVNRGSLTFWFSENHIEECQSNKKIKCGRGRPEKYPDALILAALTLRQLLNLPLRATEGLMKSLVSLMKLSSFEVPNYSTLSKRAKKIKISLGVSQQDTPRHVLVDSTGIQVIGEGEWKVLIHGKTKCQLWRKLHIAMDADTQTILAAQMTESVRLDGNYLPLLIERIEGVIAQITGDGAYDKKNCYRIAHKRNAKAVFPPQHDAIVQRNKHKKDPGLMQRDETILFIGKDKDRDERLKRWKKENNYHKRSLVETMMSRMKFIFGDRMRSKNFENQETDLMIRCRIINKMNLLGLPRSIAIDKLPI